MSRRLVTLAVALTLSAVPLFSQRGVVQRTFTPRSAGPELRGIPGSVTDPRPDGTLRGIPGSVTDPRAVNSMGVRGSFGFGNSTHFVPSRHHRFVTPVFAVPYYAYPYYMDYSAYEEPTTVQPAQPQVIIIKEEASHSDDSSRYGEHSFDQPDSVHPQVAQAQPAPAQEPEDPGPMTTLVYRDGHKSEIRNYAIVGPNLLDLTRTPVIKKIPLASLDLEATRHENEENGVDFHLP